MTFLAFLKWSLLVEEESELQQRMILQPHTCAVHQLKFFQSKSTQENGGSPNGHELKQLKHTRICCFIISHNVIPIVCFCFFGSSEMYTF